MEERKALEQLVAMAKKGDQLAKENIVEQFKPLLVKNIIKYFGKNQDFYDWLQDGRMIILSSIKSYDPRLGVPFPAYVQKQVFYYYIDQRKKTKEEIILDQPLADGKSTPLELLPSQDTDIGQAWIDLEDKERLYGALKKLTAKQKQVILGYYFHKKSLKSMAKEQELCYQALVKLKARALKRLREEMKI